MERSIVRIWSAGDQLSIRCMSQSVILSSTLLASRTLQNIQADAAQLVDVGVVYLGQEPDLGRVHGVVVGEEELELEHAALVRRSVRSMYLDVKVAEVVVVRDGADARNGLGHETLRLLDDSLGQRHGIGCVCACVVGDDVVGSTMRSERW
jgi:hypothetical protein